MRILVVSQVYSPDPTGAFLADLSGHWVDLGHQVTVLTASDGTASLDGVQVVRLTSREYHRGSLAQRAVAHAMFSAALGGRSLRGADEADLVLFVGSSWLAGVLPQPPAQRCVHWVHDVYPDAVLALKQDRVMRVFATPARLALDRAWRRADRVVAISAAMTRRLIGRVPPANVETIPLWALREWVPRADRSPELRNARGITDSAFVVLHHGNLGLAYDLEPLLQAAALLRGDRAFVFALVGRGARRREIEQSIRRRGLVNVRLFEPVAPNALVDSLAMGDVHVVGLRPGWDGISYPSKVIAGHAIGRPVFTTGAVAAEVSRSVTEAGAGLALPADGRALAEALKALRSEPARQRRMGEQARGLCDRLFSREEALARWDLLLM